MCDGTVSRQVGAADSETPEDGKQFAAAGQECAAGRTPELLYRNVPGWLEGLLGWEGQSSGVCGMHLVQSCVYIQYHDMVVTAHGQAADAMDKGSDARAWALERGGGSPQYVGGYVAVPETAGCSLV